MCLAQIKFDFYCKKEISTKSHMKLVDIVQRYGLKKQALHSQ